MTKKSEKAPSRKILTNGMILRVVSEETKARCSLDVIAAIGELGKQATVEKVIARTCETHVAPRSLIAKQGPLKPGFVRGYVTHMIRTGLIVASQPK
jgi:hypothetical protein